MAELIALLSNSLVSAVLIGYIVVLWFSLTLWASMDVFNRSENNLVRFGAIILVGVGFIFGFVLYLIIRPQATIDETKLRELEEKMLENQARSFVCPQCSELVREDFLFCPNCGLALKRECPTCHRALEIVWSQCPFCGSFAGQPVLPAIKEAPVLAASRTRGSLVNLVRGLFTQPDKPVEVKRGRGRPRKYPKDVNPKPKRPRGRPRKNVVV